MTPEAMRIAIAESEGWRIEHSAGNLWRVIHGTRLITTFKWSDFKGKLPPPTLRDVLNELPNYPEDLNVILPLLPNLTVILKTTAGWEIESHCLSAVKYLPARKQSLPLAACEFYLKWKGLWKE